MPNRLVSAAILIFWAVAAGSLIERDVLPEWLIGPPPDLHTVTKAGESSGPTSWTIYVADDPSSVDTLRPIGEVVTRTISKKDGWLQLVSHATFNSSGLLNGPVMGAGTGEQIDVSNSFDIDQAGNLYHFRAAVRANGGREELIVLEGNLKQNAIEVRATGPIPLLNWTREFPYKTRGMVQNSLSPLDKMPGLHVGQRWESRMVSPLTGRVEVVRAEVVKRGVIHWDGEPVHVLEVVTKATAMTARTWVRLDGLVLRQEVPNPLVKLFLDRRPNRPAGPSHQVQRP